MAGILLRGVRKSYGDTPVIHGVDFDVADGELIVIVGPSGCGKSTLLRMVAGLETITEGSIDIGGRVVNDLEPKDRNIAMVFQNYALYPHMSVYDNMAYGLKNAGMSRDRIRERVDKAAAMLALDGLLQRKPRQLSGGQRQRVAMGRAIVREPAAFLFDEPLSNLDAKLRVQMRLEIKRLQRSLRTTSLYVTHDQVEAMTLADRLVVMHAGVAEQIDTPLAVYEHPASVFVAGFIGSPAMNLLPARTTPDGRGVLLGDAVTLDLARAPVPPDRPVTLGLRPEHLDVVPAGEAALLLQVEVIETLGADTMAYGSPPGGAADAPFAVRLPGTHRLAVGDRLPLRPAPGTLHLFDRDSGRRLN